MKHYYPQANKPVPVATASATAPADASAARQADPRRRADQRRRYCAGGKRPQDRAGRARPRADCRAGPVGLDQPGRRGARRSHRQSPHCDGQEGQRPGADILARWHARPAIRPVRLGEETGVELPNAATVWQAPAGARLTPQTPVTLSWANTTGQTFALTFAIDADYMITVTQAVDQRRRCAGQAARNCPAQSHRQDRQHRFVERPRRPDGQLRCGRAIRPEL